MRQSRMPLFAHFAVVAVLCLSTQGLAAQQGETYDIVLRGGRVMDPETGLDAVRNVGINGTTIAAITAQPLSGRTVIDVGGLVVGPGIDRATFAEPAQFSAGIVHVLVNGTLVVTDEKVIDGVFPGVGIRRPVALVP